MTGPQQTDIVSEARELLSGITPGQWRNERQVVADENSIVVGTETYNWRFVAHTNSDTDEAGEETPPISEKEAVANAELIARAPELLRQLADEVERLRKANKSMADELGHQDSYWDDPLRGNFKC